MESAYPAQDLQPRVVITTLFDQTLQPHGNKHFCINVKYVNASEIDSNDLV